MKTLRTIAAKRWGSPLILKGPVILNSLLGVSKTFGWAKEVSQTFNRYRACHGLAFTILFFKQARWVLLKRLLNDPLEPSSRKVRVDRYGFPMVLPHSLRVVLRSLPTTGEIRYEDRVVRSISLFLLSIYTFYKGQVQWKLNLRTITDPYTGSVTALESIVKAIPRLCLRLGVIELEVKGVSFFPTNRSGPNGHALLMCHLDAAALLSNKEVDSSFRDWVGSNLFARSAQRRIFDLVGSLTSIWAEFLYLLRSGCVPDLHLGRVSLKPEHGKFRAFAIVDYFTQVVLRPLHRALFEVLKEIPMDATFNQDSGSKKVQEWTKQGRRLHCFDLSAATDRFPIQIQSAALDYLLRGYGSNLGKIWARLLVGRDYWFGSTPLRYKVGQPMGALSSWATFALCHHLMVQLAFTLAKPAAYGRFLDYTLLGDDIVIADDAVAEHYQSVMTSIGVEINRSKSVVSVGGGEFAKRSFLFGVELTGLMWDAFCKAGTSLGWLYTLIVDLRRRDYTISLPGVVFAVLGGNSKQHIVGNPLRSFLISLVERGGPLEDIVLWWRAAIMYPRATVWDWSFWSFALSSHTDDIPDKALNLGDSDVWNHARYRRLLSGHELADWLISQLDHVLGSSILSLFQDYCSRNGFSSRDPPRDLVERLMKVHPALPILQEGMEQWGEDDTQELRVITRADREEIFLHKELVARAQIRANLLLDEVYPTRDEGIFDRLGEFGKLLQSVEASHPFGVEEAANLKALGLLRDMG